MSDSHQSTLPPGVLLAVDFGRARHGVAMADGAGILASPLTVVEVASEPAAVAELAELAGRHQAVGWVVGLPLSKDGEENEATRRVRSFAGRLKQASRLPVAFQDERHSTEEALDRLKDTGAGLVRAKAGKDSWAAALILQDWLDARKGAGERGSAGLQNEPNV
ncbi:MAG: Holliday junction resolvase RuvX [Planctomycetota bacterium]